MKMGHYLGLDVGSVTTKLVVVDEGEEVLFESYLRTAGSPVEAVQESFRRLAGDRRQWDFTRAGTTGSGRQLAALMTGADVVKNEITAHSVAARRACPGVRTVIDIGGQDSKIIFLRDGMCTGFNMNTVCAAGTGSFLDHQAARLGLSIETLGDHASRAQHAARIAGRCGVFAESDLIHKQQMGYSREDLVAGLCAALVANYLTNVARGKRILPPALFQGGVAANRGIVEAFRQSLGFPVQVPEHFQVMGAWGAAILARRAAGPTRFRGVDRIAGFRCRPRTAACGGCANNCEINELVIDGEVAGRWGGRCPESPGTSSHPG